MEKNMENKIEFQEKLISFYNQNKLKVYVTITILIIVLISVFLITINLEKKNSLIAEKYIQAGVFLASDKKENSKKIYEEIISSKNKFYSVLSLNNILENNLETNTSKILEYFKIIEDLNYPDENSDLIALKKALYLIKNSEFETSNKLLKKLIDKDSKLKNIAKDLIIK